MQCATSVIGWEPNLNCMCHRVFHVAWVHTVSLLGNNDSQTNSSIFSFKFGYFTLVVMWCIEYEFHCTELTGAAILFCNRVNLFKRECKFIITTCSQQCVWRLYVLLAWFWLHGDWRLQPVTARGQVGTPGRSDERSMSLSPQWKLVVQEQPCAILKL